MLNKYSDSDSDSDQITDSQEIVRDSLNFGMIFLTAQESKTLTDIFGV